MAVGTAALSHGEVTTPVRYALIVLLGLAMGLQNAVVRSLGVPDLTTTVLTLTLTGLAADSVPAGGAAPRPGRRLLSVPAMFLGALAGAVLLAHAEVAAVLGPALVLLMAVSVVTHRLSATDADWVRPTH